MTARAALLLGVTLLAGCITARPTLHPGYMLGADGQGVVVGRMERVDREGGPLLVGDALLASLGEQKFPVIHENTGETYWVQCEPGGQLSDFYVALPAGRYRMDAWLDSDFSELVRIRFDVPEGRAIYVGTLRYRGAYVWPTTRGEWTVVDDSALTIVAFRARFPAIAPVEVSLARITPD
jgi:hypothetical protein